MRNSSYESDEAEANLGIRSPVGGDMSMTKASSRPKLYGDKQDRRDQALARREAAVPRSLHVDVGLVAEPGRTLVLETHRAMHPSRDARL
jgi:hypothetical protein